MVNIMVERATNEMLIDADWAMNLEICDMLNRDPSQAKDVIKGVKKPIGSKNPKVQLLTLTLLETLVKNCGDLVHMQVAEKDVLHELVRIVKRKPDFHVKDKILIMIDTWQEAFGGPRARYPQYYAAYQELLRAGAVFPQRSESSAPVFTPPQSQPLSHYPPNIQSSDFPQEATATAAPAPSSQAQVPTLSLAEIQNARGIMDVLAEMLNALDPGNKEGLRQEVIVDLAEQCRTYKLRVTRLVESPNIDDATLVCQALALNDDLDRLLRKHDAIASGTPVLVEQPIHEPIRAVVPVESLLIDTGDSAKWSDKRPISASNTGGETQQPLLALPAPPEAISFPPLLKLDPKIDLLSGDDYNSPTVGNNMAIVPLGEPQPASPMSQQNALVLAGFYSDSNITGSSGAQPSYFTGQTQPATSQYNQPQKFHLPQGMPYANGSAQSQLQNTQSSQPVPYTNGSTQNPGVPQFQKSMNPWNGQHAQQQPSASSVDGSQSDSSFPPPPWEAQLDESIPPAAITQYPHTLVGQSLEMQQHVPYGQQQNGLYPQPVGSEQMVNSMYMQSGNQPFQSNQYPQQGTSQMYPQQQIYGYHMGGLGYSQGYGQQQDPRLLLQQMQGLAMRENYGGMLNNSYPTAASAASYSSAVKPKKPEDKLFGDLVDLSKFKIVKPSVSWASLVSFAALAVEFVHTFTGLVKEHNIWKQTRDIFLSLCLVLNRYNHLQWSLPTSPVGLL